jgi:hypothetical protein
MSMNQLRNVLNINIVSIVLKCRKITKVPETDQLVKRPPANWKSRIRFSPLAQIFLFSIISRMALNSTKLRENEYFSLR